jgi:hypothetical protein
MVPARRSRCLSTETTAARVAMQKSRTRLRGMAGTWAALGLFAAVGCVSSDLSKDAKVTAAVAECLPPGTAAPTEIVSAIWFPNASGFGSADNTGMGHISGVLALAGNKLWFMSWNGPERHYDMQHVVSFLPALKVDVAREGSAAMLVIESGNRSFDGFELMSGGQIGSDPATTQRLCEEVRAIRARNPEPEI